ncbi:hypothetical protein BOW14_08250 [Solemya velum gill symbiont]|uniref:hypothetical protein n=1 Tax=Solemya velum gill symbiont TaxID=2340 RepID=UPI0009980099|nr:hypothetical protein [Solemya velum gill symbiont]OOY86419.1 hypothetical protein BOW14_08250 [Solemya velum gill symbiont]
MKLNPNPELNDVIEAIEENNRQHSSIWWIIVIAIGVLLGSVASHISIEAYYKWQTEKRVKESAIIMQEKLEKASQKVADQVRVTAEEKKEDRKKHPKYIQLKQVCEFWQQQVNIQNSQKNRSLRNSACREAEAYLTKPPEEKKP